MGKIAVIADVHAARHSGSDTRFAECLKALEWAYATAEESGCSTMVVAGDLFHDRSRIDVSVYSGVYRALRDLSKRLETVFVVGNHDMYLREDRRVNSLIPLEQIGRVVSSPSAVETVAGSFDVLPYCEGAALSRAGLETAFPRRQRMLVAHVAIEGAVLNGWGTRATASSLVDSDGFEETTTELLDPGSLSGWELVLCGHYHVPQVVRTAAPRIEYVGSLLQHTFGESGSANRLVVVDLDLHALSPETHENRASPKFIVCDGSALEEKSSSGLLRSGYVRIVVPPMTSTAVIAALRKKAESLGAASVDFRETKKTAVEKRDDEGEMDEVVERLKSVANDPQKLVSEYVALGPRSWNAGSKEELEEFAKMDRLELERSGMAIVSSAEYSPSSKAAQRGRVELKRVKAKNFMSIGDPGVDLVLADLPNMVLIRGENADVSGDGATNGAGKSAVLVEAPAWCLFGETFRKLTKAQILRSGAKGKCEVSVEANGFVITRGIKPDFLRFARSNGEDLTRATMSETQAMIESELGIDWDSYSFLACFDAETWKGFVGVGEKQRRTLAEKLLSLDSHGAYLEAARKAFNASKASAQSFRALAEAHAENAEEKASQAVSMKEMESALLEERRKRVTEAAARAAAAPSALTIAEAEAAAQKNELLIAEASALSEAAVAASEHVAEVRRLLDGLAAETSKIGEEERVASAALSAHADLEASRKDLEALPTTDAIENELTSLRSEEEAARASVRDLWNENAVALARAQALRERALVARETRDKIASMDLEQMKKELASEAALSAKEEELAAKAAVLSEELAAATWSFEAAIAEEDAARAELQRVAEMEEGECPTCHAPVTRESKEAVSEALERRLSRASSTRSTAEETKRSAEKRSAETGALLAPLVERTRPSFTAREVESLEAEAASSAATADRCELEASEIATAASLKASAIASHDARIATLEKSRLASEASLMNLLESRSAAKGKVEAHAKKVFESGFKTWAEASSALVSAKTKLEAVAAQIDEGTSYLKTAEARASEAASAAKRIMAGIDQNAPSRADVAAMREAKFVAEADLAAASASLDAPSQYSEAIAVAEKEALAAGEKSDVAASQADEAEKESFVAKFWVRGFEPAGVRAMVVSQVVSALNEEVEKWISDCLGGDVSVRFDSSLEAIVSWKSSDAVSSYAQMSSGEKRRIDLATLFAFARVMQAVIGVELDYIVFDEVADKLDRDGVEGIASSLRELSRYKRIMVVTHHPTLVQTLEGAHELLVKREGGVTTVRAGNQPTKGP